MLITAVVSGVGAVMAAIWARQSREVTKAGNEQAAETSKIAAADRKAIQAQVEQNNHLTTQSIAVARESTRLVTEVLGNSGPAPLSKL